MEVLHAVDYGLTELRGVVASIEAAEADEATNCEPWTVRRLASHALNNQLFWAGLVASQPTVSFEDSMGAVAIEGDLGVAAADVATRAAGMWRADGIIDAIHATPLGEVPGSVVARFAVIDALAHSWDLSSSLGRAVEFDPDEMEWIAEVVAATCNDDARALGLIKAPTSPPPDATDTERLMAAAGRTISR